MVRLFEQIRGKRLEILKAPDRIARVRDQILESIGSPPTLRDLAAEADLHPAHLCRAFRRQYGCAMGDLLRRARIERAVACLENPESGSLSKIAFALGFCDQAHLTRQFRQFIGVPPGTFRRLRCKHDSIQGSVNPSN
jgi:AraC family transcriptional regulator